MKTYILTVFLLLITIQNITCYPSMARYYNNKPKRQLVECSNGQVDIDGSCEDNDLDDSDFTSEVILDEDIGFKIQWSFDSDDSNVAYFIVQQEQRGFMSFGFGDSMDGTDVISMYIDGGAIVIDDCKAQGYQNPPKDSTQNVQLLGYEVSNSLTKVKFRRNLDTGDSNDYKLKKGSDVKIMAIYGDTDNVVQHGVDDKWFATINFDENVSVKGEQSDGATVTKTHNAHTWGLLVCWGILTDISIVIARNFKTWKLYMWIHAIIFILVDFYTIIIVIMKVVQNKDALSSISDDIILIHFILGIAFIVLVFFQHIGGIILKYSAESTIGRKDYIEKVKKGHKYNGYFLYIFGKFMCINGALSNAIYQDKDSLVIIGVIFVIAGFLIHIASFIVNHVKKNSSKKYIEVQDESQAINKQVTQQVQENEKIVELITQGKNIHDIKKIIGNDKLLYCIYENRVCNLQQLMHPGGNYIITKINGREIDRCFFGGYALEGDRRAGHLHSVFAEKYLLENTIGYLQYPESQNVLNNISTSNKVWQLGNINKITPTTSLIHFKNSEYKFKNYNKGVEWLGRYFQVKYSKNEKRRLYTTVQSMTQDNINFRKEITQMALDGFNGQVTKMSEFSDYLPLIIKHYEYKNTLSGIIHGGLGENFHIKGPQGTGLNLTNSSEGKIIIITGGTGILPFLDLLNFMLMKIIYEVAKKEKGEDFAENNVDIHQIGLKSNFDNLQIQLYSSYMNEQEFLGKDIIVPMLQIAEKYNLQDKFSFKAKFSKKCQIEGVTTINSHFNKKLFEEESKQWGNNVQRVLICGPPPMNAAVPPALSGLVEEQKIQFI